MVERRFVGGTDLIEKHAKKGFGNYSEFARYLHEVEPARSVQAWRVAIQRWVNKGNTFHIERVEFSEDSITADISRMKIYYDKGEDVYLTWIDTINDLLKIDGEMHRNMRRAYSDTSGGMTADEMALKFEIPSSWIRQYIRAHGWSHKMDPFTDEEVLENDTESLTELLLFERRRKIAVDAQKQDWIMTQKEAKQFREMDSYLLSEFKEIIAQSDLSHEAKHVEMKEGDPYALVISPTDLHYGKYGWEFETGEQYGFDEARNRLIEKTEALISRLPSRPERIIVATGSDWFHVDNDHGTTTKGTPQDMAGSPAQILMGGCKLAREHIEMLRGIAPIEIVFMNGNHDRYSALALAIYLEAVYENCEDVDVSVSPKVRQYVTWGNNLLGFTHGDFVKGTDLPVVMANEKQHEWGSCQNKMWFSGHKHHTHMIETGGCFVIQLPSLSGHDRYHHKHAFTNRPGIFAFLVDKQEGVIGSLYAPVIKGG